jgi:hypothetical protein
VLRAIGFVVSAMLVGSMAGARAFAQVADIDATGLIKLDVSVTDAAGRPVANLGPADFTLLDNGQPAHIRTFEVLGRPDPTLEVILLIDTLRIPGALAEQVRLTAEEFLHRLEEISPIRSRSSCSLMRDWGSWHGLREMATRLLTMSITTGWSCFTVRCRSTPMQYFGIRRHGTRRSSRR